MLLKSQNKINQTKYVNLLSAVGGLSKLFSSSSTPYLYYRAHENIFCLTLGAENESRGDVSVDAVLDNVGVGLKTYIKKGSQYEKVAEFNRLINKNKKSSGDDLVRLIANARNERIDMTKRMYGLNQMLYHCVVRSDGKFMIHEENMDLIDLKTIKIDLDDGASIKFHDHMNTYSFNISKSTLFKKFSNDIVDDFEVNILDDPFSFLLDKSKNLTGTFAINQGEQPSHRVIGSIVLPLYSDRNEGVVQEKSGLNQWNAGGRNRDYDEVYIPIPAWIHKKFKGFFPERDKAFNLRLPGKEIISAKVCQDGNKALMSNPNKKLGEWLLRKVLNLKKGELLTYKKLLDVGVDSVLITKNSTTEFEIDFKKVGTYSDFKNQYYL